MLKASQVPEIASQLGRVAGLLFAFAASSACLVEPDRHFSVSFPASVRKEPVTGRVYVIVSKDPEIRDRTRRSLGHQPVSSSTGSPFFARDVHNLEPDQRMTIDESAPAYPVESLRDLPAGDYYVQAIVNVYSKFDRSDGHVIWAPRDEWDGQHFNWSPGNLISEIRKVSLDPDRGFDVHLEANQVLPPMEVPEDTTWIKRVKFQSELLTRFWGQPVYLGATLLLPKGYDRHRDVDYATIYYQGHFSLDAPFGFTTLPVEESEATRRARRERNLETGYEFYQAWNSDDFPRMVGVTFQHPTPYFDDSYAVNSANNGPYADAIRQELIPYLEERFRLIPKPYARLLTGGSTGGYEALALQVHHPQFFGGAWVFYPDPVDFRRLFTINIYEDESAFYESKFPGFKPLRYAYRAPDGQPLQSIRQLSQLARSLGSRGRSTDYLEAWEAAFGPVDEDGYPKPLWDKRTGEIDPDVARYWRENGYDLSEYLKRKWPEIGSHLEGKIRVYCGDMDDYYFNLAVYLLEEVLENTSDPHFGGHFEYGRPQKGHGWRPMNHADLVREMAEHVTRNTP